MPDNFFSKHVCKNYELRHIFKIWFLSKIHKRIYKAYGSIDFLPIWNYKKVEKTSDVRYLIKGIDYEHLPNVYLKLNDIWERLQSDFIEQSNPEAIGTLVNDFITNFLPINQYNYLIMAIKILSNKDFVSEGKRNELIEKIKMLGYPFNQTTDNDYYNSIINLERQLVGLKRNINIKIYELKKKQVEKSDQLDIEEILTMFISVFPGTVFNSKTLTCKQYLNYLKRYNKIATEANKQAQNNQKQGNYGR